MTASPPSRRRALPQVTTLAGCALLILTGCASVEPREPAPMALPAFTGATAVEPAADSTVGVPPGTGTDVLLALDDAMRDFVGERLLPVVNPTERMRELSRLLLESPEHALQYQGDLTLSARELFRQRTGNCLSATALVVALAREAGLDAAFQDVPVVPSWHLSGTTFVVERHVNAVM